MTEAVIEMKAVSKHFGHREAVSNLTLEIPAGQALALLGPNGAGKTTSIAMMLGLTRPSRGHIRLFGADPGSVQAHTRIGVMLQGVSVPDRLTVKESLNLFRGVYPRPLSLAHLLDISGLEGDARKMAGQLSGGKTRRLQFAAAMAGDPQMLFLDEPTVGMDVASKRQFWDTLRTFIADGRTLVLTTHDLQEADVVADRVVVMNSGRVIADAAPERIKMEFGGRQVSFVAAEGQAVDGLRQWAEVQDMHTAGRHVTVLTKDSDHVVRRLILEGWDISDIMIAGGGLEEAFVRLTGQTGSPA